MHDQEVSQNNTEMDYFKNKLSEGLMKLVSTKEVKHFNGVRDSFLLHSDSRKHYLRQFNEALVKEISYIG